MSKSKQYLGDGVYVEIKELEYAGGDVLILTTNNGLRDLSTIYLEPQVLQLLLMYLDKQPLDKCPECGHDIS